MKDWAIDCLKEPEKACQAGEGRKKTALREWMWGVKDRKSTIGRMKTTLRVIELIPAPTKTSRYPRYSPDFHLGSVKVMEYGV